MGYKGKSTESGKYRLQRPVVVDLHGMNQTQAIETVARAIDQSPSGSVLHIIVGRGRAPAGSILGPAVKQYLSRRGYNWRPARLADGGDGVVVVSL